MATFDGIGEVGEKLHIEWRIEDFLALEENDKVYSSSSFSFAGHSWCLRMYPNGRESDKSVGYVGIHLRRNSFGAPIKIDYRLGVKTLDEDLLHGRIFGEMKWRGFSKYLLRSELLEKMSDFAPANVLTVVCVLKLQKSTGNESK